LNGKAEALSHGAATIVNAIALGKGAAFGVGLWTKAEVRLTDEPAIIKGEITSDPNESTVLIERTVARVFQYFGVEKRFGAKVKTWSNIPIARGLKSSSVAANAVALATVAALGEMLDDLAIVKLGVEAAFDAKVTVTGDSDVNKLRLVKPLVKIAYKEALKGNFWASLTLNGLIYSSALGYNTSIALDALTAGALAAGLCGKGPAVTAVVSDDKIDSVKTALQCHEGEVLQARLNHEKAKVI
jgi:shikimate kinase